MFITKRYSAAKPASAGGSADSTADTRLTVSLVPVTESNATLVLPITCALTELVATAPAVRLGKLNSAKVSFAC